MRNLYCDFSPHLPSDMHPYWYLTMQPALQYTLPASQDPYAANTWYFTQFSQPMPSTPGQADNPSVFNNIGLAPHNSGHIPYTASGGLGNTSVVSGNINPPGTWPPGPWYIVPPLVQFGPFGGCGGGGTYQPGIWGFNDLPVSCPDILPAIVNYNHHGLRYDCQVWPTPSTPESNLQTFLSVMAEVEPLPTSALRQSLPDVERTLRSSMERIRSKR